MLSMNSTQLNKSNRVKIKYFRSFKNKTSVEEKKDLSPSRLRTLIYELYVQLKSSNPNVTLIDCIDILSNRYALSSEALLVRISR
ncbi:hypothetical protein FHS70_002576 [Flammeovirga yaeyamensis]|nr:hypothetical protein [Flammeovirga yaeyamensis]